MNNYVITEIDDAQKKMSAYVTLLSYRYMNLCVKAELGALMPVNVTVRMSFSSKSILRTRTISRLSSRASMRHIRSLRWR